MSKASPLPDRVSTSWVQDRPAVEHISNGGSTSGVPRLKKKHKLLQQQLQEEGEHVWEEVLHTPKSVEQEGKKVLNMLDSPAGDGADYAAGSCSPGRSMEKRRSTCSLCRTQCWSKCMFEGGCGLVENCTWASSWQHLWPQGVRSPHWKQVYSQELLFYRRLVGISLHSMILECTPWNGLMLKQFVENCSVWGGPTLENFVKKCLPLGQEKELRRKEWQRQRDQFTTTPILFPPASFRGMR